MRSLLALMSQEITYRILDVMYSSIQVSGSVAKVRADNAYAGVCVLMNWDVVVAHRTG